MGTHAKSYLILPIGRNAWEHRFWPKVDKNRPNGCWLWKASLRPDGAGQFMLNRIPQVVYVLAWRITHGPIPEWGNIFHRCRRPACLNPAHLYMGTLQDREPPEERFWASIDKREGGRWLWTKTPGALGYGNIQVRDKLMLSHRYSWELANGPIPDGLFCLHKCDTRLCVNPEHLFLGTQGDNVRDMVSKGRQAKGERSGRAKLTRENVEEARSTVGEVGLTALAKRYGVSFSSMWAAVRRITWKSVP